MNTTFETFDFNASLLRGIISMGYTNATEIQSEAIPIIGEGKDLIAQSQSGTGKTASFAIGTIQKVNGDEKSVQILVLTSTRELALQIYDTYSKLSQFMGLRIVCCVGGVEKRVDKNALRDGAHIVIGTPGRIDQLQKEKALNLSSLRTLVLDEADEILSKDGLLDNVQSIFRNGVPSDAQVCLFSATMTTQVVETADRIMKDPVKLLLKRKNVAVKAIRQFYIEMEEEHKLETALDLAEQVAAEGAIIFCNHKQDVEKLYKAMKDHGISVEAFHSDLSQGDREHALEKFRNCQVRFLIGTDALARGIDIQHISLVINYNYPSDYSTYMHRIGRAGRFGRKGVAINFLAPRDEKRHSGLQDFFKMDITPLPENVNDFV